MEDRERVAVDEPVGGGVRGDLDPQPAPAYRKGDRQTGDVDGQAGREARGALSLTQAGESGREGDPGPSESSHVEAVTRVVLEIVEVHEGSLGQVVVR